MIGSPLGCSSRCSHLPSDEASTRAGRSAKPSRAERIATGSVLTLTSRSVFAVDNAEVWFLPDPRPVQRNGSIAALLCANDIQSLHQAPKPACAEKQQRARLNFDREISPLGSRHYAPTILRITLPSEQFYDAKIQMAIPRSADMDGRYRGPQLRRLLREQPRHIGKIAALRAAVCFEPSGRTE